MALFETDGLRLCPVLPTLGVPMRTLCYPSPIQDASIPNLSAQNYECSGPEVLEKNIRFGNNITRWEHTLGHNLAQKLIFAVILYIE